LINLLFLNYVNQAFFAKIEKDAKPIIYSGEWSSPEFLDFVKLNNHPLVAELSAHNFRALGSIGPKLLIGVVDPGDVEKKAALQKELREFAASSESLRGKYIFAWMDGIKFDKFLKQFGIEKRNLPQVFALDFSSRLFWQDNSTRSIKEFTEAVENGDIPVQKQAEPPTYNAFQQVKMVFLEFMPWSALIIVSIFILTYFAFLPEKADFDPSSSVSADSLKVEKETEPKKEK
jgi:hypothetical protein